MSWKIIADSSSDLHCGIPCAPGTSFAIVPLKIRVGDREFVDDQQLELDQLMDALRDWKGPSSSACPSPEEWAREFAQADCSIGVAMTSGLSGTYNSAMVARELVLEAHPEKKIHIIDTLATGGKMALLVQRINRLIGEGLDFDRVVQAAEEYSHNLELLFTLCSFENLIKNGRMSRVVGSIASTLNIRMVGRASSAGKLEILHKIRGESRTLDLVVSEMGKRKDPRNSPVVISHCRNPQGAQVLAEKIAAAYSGVQITIMPTHALTSYYAQESGLLVGF